MSTSQPSLASCKSVVGPGFIYAGNEEVSGNNVMKWLFVGWLVLQNVLFLPFVFFFFFFSGNGLVLWNNLLNWLFVVLFVIQNFFFFPFFFFFFF